ncbi:zinc transport system substrate-binding protein [Marinitoga hydrogenitolerans DSM 16785]|uniref:Zinc transport system substrate-binding protein n=1 Tax=Marinitoga hydrogenitolerans (strain DSM 16785 / JCM 12826 / AT1271) TaxID=1122195 RepID=A0A1M4VHN3_MARH1|nr:metal ABC transporter substrate-binding protein [Marinitoga hydrogenitolerans]SHE68323.1 zinc transport system substrate-binding protein [Marinitoga hydrogenitolerans DSM 16785]
MKKYMLLLFLIIGVISYSINISVSIYPYYLILKDIVDVNDNINVIVPAGKSPHTYSISSKDLIKIYKSDLIIFNGLNSEIFIKNIISNLKNKNIPFLYISELIPKNELILNDNDEHYNSGNDERVYYNPHIWLNPHLTYTYIIPGIVNELIKINPEKKEIYETNAEILKDKLKFLDAYLLIKSHEIDGSIITFHNSFPYFTKRYNINIAGVIENSPGVEPSISEIKRLSDLAKKNKVKALFSEPQLNKKLAEKLAKILRINLGELDPLGSNYNSIDELYLMNFLNILNAVR